MNSPETSAGGESPASRPQSEAATGASVGTETAVEAAPSPLSAAERAISRWENEGGRVDASAAPAAISRDTTV
jgi:hypothetical protein